MDILSDELSRARAQGAVFSVLHQVSPWGLRFEGHRPLTAHILLKGSGFLVREGTDPIPLQTRDVVLATAGTPYEVVSEVGALTVPIAAAREKPLSPHDLDGPANAIVMCGAYVLSGSVGESLLQSLPAVAIVAGRDQDPAHAAAIDLLAAEALAIDSGQQALLDRLLDVNLVYALRAWWRTTDAAPGWYRALGHPPIRTVLEQLHADPALDWTLPAMARAAGLSRAAFAAQFARIVGVPAGRYLTQLRMRRAEDALSRTDQTLASIAGSVGYSNEFAFATAFRRQHGVSPGRWRNSQVEELTV
ncbi:AraC family transcriptional regulator [Kribbella antibiotica]|uniref:AraC family transcriptional regulator n=1 Tax=Kribbella antibiotica TaxID=190195 RepID=A0A4R4ZJ74_9ACTN|nr:AraC family transcriptional regulator [Kribbella antibiotica]TDD57814.1 AraC family transcriptional regulator [Kribbella antibiotica]